MATRENSLSKNPASYFDLTVNRKQLVSLEVLNIELSLTVYHIILINILLYLGEK